MECLVHLHLIIDVVGLRSISLLIFLPPFVLIDHISVIHYISPIVLVAITLCPVFLVGSLILQYTSL